MKTRFNLLFFFLSLTLGFMGCEYFSMKSKSTSKDLDRISGAYEALQMQSFGKSYPDNDIPIRAYADGLATHKKLPKRISRSDFEWESMGPHNTAGRTLALAINPQADSTIYLGSASGGLWRSRKLGLGVSWEYVETMDDVLGVSSVCFAEGDSTLMYIGTGEVYNIIETGDDAASRATRGSYGVGILRSIDGGNTWTKSLDWSYNQRRGIQSIQINPLDKNIAYAATTEGIYKTTDMGASWEVVLNLPMCTDVQIHQSNPNIVVAAFGNLGNHNTGIYRTEDAGVNWVRYTDSNFPSSFQGKIELTSSKSDPNVFYASIGNGFSFNDGATWLLKSVNDGVSWEQVNDFDYSRWQGWFAHDVAVHPSDPDIIMAVGIDCWKSTDGGLSLEQVSIGGVTLGDHPIGEPDGDRYYSHSDHHVALFHPNIPDLVLLGNDGGLFHANEGGTNYMSANGGLQTTQFYNGFSVSHLDDDLAMGGLQDNSSVIYRGSKAWTRVIGGDGAYSAINYDNDDIMFGSSQNLRIRKSIDKGESFYGVSPIQSDDVTVFIAPFVISEASSNIVYAGSQFLYKSVDNGETFLRMNNGQALNGSPIFNIGTSPVDEDLVLASTFPENNFPAALFQSVDGGLSFIEINDPILPDRVVNDITFDPFDGNTVYLTYNGFGSSHLFVSEDAGITWRDISTDLPDVPGNAIAVDPANTDHLYYGNDIGIYFSPDKGDTWQTLEDGIKGAFIVMDLKISPFDQTIWLATHGRGAFTRNLESKDVVSIHDIDNRESDFEIFPNPIVNGQLYLKNKTNEKRTVDYRILSIDGTIQDRGLENILGQESHLIDVQNLSSGTYILSLYLGDQHSDLKFVVL